MQKAQTATFSGVATQLAHAQPRCAQAQQRQRGQAERRHGLRAPPGGGALTGVSSHAPATATGRLQRCGSMGTPPAASSKLPSASAKAVAEPLTFQLTGAPRTMGPETV